MNPVSRSEAVDKLASTDMHERLVGSRYFMSDARPEDRGLLEEALRKEDVSWIRARLQAALATATGEPLPERDRHLSIDSENGPVADIFAAAVEDTTRQLLHEIGPVAGAIKFYAEREIPDFDTSKTKKHLVHLTGLLGAIRRLSEAASSPQYDTFNLAQKARDVAQLVLQETTQVRFNYRGPDPLIVSGDPELIELVLLNGLKNAVEATISLLQGEQTGRVVISWDETSEGAWIAIHDEGPGPPKSIDRAFDIGTTNKAGHLGMGLAIARQAIESLNGTIKLGPSGDAKGGSRFYFSWPYTSDGLDS